MKRNFESSRGYPLPFGVSKHPKGFNFSVFSKHATLITLILFDAKGEMIAELALDPETHKTGDVWHIFVFDLQDDCHYGYRASGPYDPLKGYYFDERNILLDPHAKLVDAPSTWGTETKKSAHPQMKGAIHPLEPYHWDHDHHPNIPFKDLIIYEMHVRGFTQDASSQVKEKGKFLGIIEKIPYLKSLGINALELMPIHEFNECENININRVTGDRLYQYWGYSTINFFSPMGRYATETKKAINEFKTLVQALHANGIEVILDVVYNHTAEGNQNGPLLSFKGLENPVYYMLGPNGEYYNFSGCGNTFNCNHPAVRHFIRDSLRYWVTEMHVDGFRFDLASVLARDHDGIPLDRPPLIEAITLDPILANTKLIAEAWDAGGLYQVGKFPGLRTWAEWNGMYRDGVRRFIKGTDGLSGDFATRLFGSEDLYGKGRYPYHSINFVTAHDGFSLADLVSYSQKHNESNGEYNRDGSNDNDSWNCGVEGPTNDPKILELRNRQMKNFHLALMVSQGVPMLVMGDEYGHTKNGNNNSWCHDSRLNWFQWDTLEKSQSFFRFYQMAIAFRKRHPIFSNAKFLKEKDVVWHGKDFFKPDWSPKNRFVAFTLQDVTNNYALYIAFNAHFEEITFKIPPPGPHTPWKLLIETAKNAPEDIVEENVAKEFSLPTYTLPPHAAFVLKRQLH